MLPAFRLARYQNGTPPKAKHDADIHFTFVMDGKMTLIADGNSPVDLEAGDAFVIPPGLVTEYGNCSSDLELLEAGLRGDFTSRIVG